MNNIIPCTRDFYVVYTLEEDDHVSDLVEDPVVAWEIEDGVLKPIPADQLFADENYHAIRYGELYYGEFGSGQTRDDVIRYFSAKLKRQIEKKASVHAET